MDDYYPFGLTFNSYINTAKNNYLYNQGFGDKTFQGEDGKSFAVERQPELGIDLTKFRAYDPALGRFMNIDPLADKANQESVTPYHYSLNNPVRFNDPFGDCPKCYLFEQAWNDFVANLGFSESPSKQRSTKKDQWGGTVVIGKKAGADQTSTSAEFIDGETPIDGFDQIGKSGPSGSASENIANALGSIFSAVSEFFSDESSSTDTNNQETEKKDPTVVDSDTTNGDLIMNGNGVLMLENSQIINQYSDGSSDTLTGTIYLPTKNFYEKDKD